MGIEIERRFLIKNEDWKSKIILSENFSQAYLNSSVDEWATRVRIIDNNAAYLTLKSSLNGLANYEFEYSIPIKDAIELIKLWLDGSSGCLIENNNSCLIKKSNHSTSIIILDENLSYYKTITQKLHWASSLNESNKK